MITPGQRGMTQPVAFKQALAEYKRGAGTGVTIFSCSGIEADPGEYLFQSTVS
jgi:hypothetical protein